MSPLCLLEIWLWSSTCQSKKGENKPPQLTRNCKRLGLAKKVCRSTGVEMGVQEGPWTAWLPLLVVLGGTWSSRSPGKAEVSPEAAVPRRLQPGSDFLYLKCPSSTSGAGGRWTPRTPMKPGHGMKLRVKATASNLLGMQIPGLHPHPENPSVG